MGTNQQRDADMDRLLRAVLKPASREAGGECPDAAMLAAFVEGNLSPDEQSTLDAHFGRCARCQGALAVLGQDEPHREEQGATGWFTWVVRPRLRWLVPVTAAATVAVVFFATRPLIAPEGDVSRSEIGRMAQGPPAATEVPPPARNVVPVEPKAEPAKESLGSAARQGTSKAQPQPAEEPRPTAVTLTDAVPEPEGERDKKPVEPASKMMAARIAAEEPRVQPGVQTPGAVPAAPGTPPTPPSAGVQKAVAPQPADVPPAGEAAQRAAAPAQANLQAAGSPRRQTAAEEGRAAAAATPPRKDAQRLEAGLLVLSAPGGEVQWRFGAGGRVSRSSDGGASWHAQVSGVTAELLAGAAPSPATCWVVGASGTVLLTRDGERWERRPFPESVDLVAVEASSARSATVTARDGRRFATVDGGLSWSQR